MAPTIAVGTAAAGGNVDVTPTLPAHQAGDWLYVDVETANEAVTCPTTGWNEALDSPQSVSAGGGSVRLTTFCKLAASSSETNPTIQGTTNHKYAVPWRVRGAKTTGEGVNVTSGGNETTDTSLSIAGDTTTVADCLIVYSAARSSDETANQFSSEADSTLTSLTELHDNGTLTGNGGGIGLWSGVKAAAGAYGPLTATLAVTAAKGFISRAFEPLPATVSLNHIATTTIFAPIIFGDVSLSHIATTQLFAPTVVGSAFPWSDIIVPPTASSGLTSGDHTSVDEDPPWSDADVASELTTALATGTFIFSGFDLSLAGGEKEGFHIWLRASSSVATGHEVTIVLKQDTTTLWTSDPITTDHTNYETYVIPIPNSAFVGSDIDNLSLEFSVENLAGSSNTFRVSWLRISKSPFTTAQKAVLPSTLVGQDFVVYRISDLGVLGASSGESIILIPDASGNGRHAILVAGTAATYETDAPLGLEALAVRYIGTLGFDPATNAPIRWTNNLILHAKVYPTSLTTDHVISSTTAVDADFAHSGGTADKHLVAVQAAVDWVLMSGDGSGPSHKAGGTPTVDVETRLTEWVQIAGGNEHMWEDDDVSPVIDAESGSNPFTVWSLLDRETDNRPWIGRLIEWWAIEATGITEADIDTARAEWVNGIGQVVTLTLISSTTVFAPSGINGAVTLDHIGPTATLFAPTVNGQVALGLIASTVVHEPVRVAGINVGLGHISTTVINAPTVNGSVSLEVIATTVVHEPVNVSGLNVGPGHISTTQLFAPQINGSVSLDLIASTQLFAPVVGATNVLLAHIGPVASLFDVEVNGSVALGTIASTQIFAPTLNSAFSLAHIGPTAVVFAPEITGSVSLAHIATTTLFDPQINGQIALGVISTTALFAPEVIEVAEDEINIPHIGPTSVLFDAQLNGQITLDHISTTALFDPNVAGRVALDHIASTVIFDPTLNGNVSLAPIATTVVNAPSVTGNVSLAHISTTQLFAPTFGETISLNHISTTVVFAPVVAATNLLLGHIASTALFAFTLQGEDIISLTHIGPTASLFAPSVEITIQDVPGPNRILNDNGRVLAGASRVLSGGSRVFKSS